MKVTLHMAFPYLSNVRPTTPRGQWLISVYISLKTEETWVTPVLLHFYLNAKEFLNLLLQHSTSKNLNLTSSMPAQKTSNRETKRRSSTPSSRNLDICKNSWNLKISLRKVPNCNTSPPPQKS